MRLAFSQLAASSYARLAFRSYSVVNGRLDSASGAVPNANIMPLPVTSLFDILKEKYKGRKGLSALKKSKLTWGDVETIKASVEDDMDKFKLEVEKTLLLTTNDAVFSNLVAAHLTVIAFPPQTPSSTTIPLPPHCHELLASVRKSPELKSHAVLIEKLLQSCVNDNMPIRHIKDDVRFDPFGVASAIVPTMSRDDQIVKVFASLLRRNTSRERIIEANRLNIFTGGSRSTETDRENNNLPCSIAGPGSGKTWFCSSLSNPDLLMMEKVNRNLPNTFIKDLWGRLCICGVSFNGSTHMNESDKLLNLSQRLWARVLYQELCVNCEFKKFIRVFDRHPTLKELLTFVVVIPLVRLRHGREYVLLIIDELIKCSQSTLEIESMNDAYSLLTDVGANLNNDGNFGLFVTSLNVKPVNAISVSGRPLDAILLPNMISIATDIVTDVIQLSSERDDGSYGDAKISENDAYRAVVACIYHPRAMEKLLDFSRYFCQNFPGENDFVQSFFVQLKSHYRLSWAVEAPEELIYSAIFGELVDFKADQFAGMDRYLMNIEKSDKMIPILSPTQLYWYKKTRQLTNLGLQINDPKDFEMFFANWICVRVQLLILKQSGMYRLSTALGIHLRSNDVCEEGHHDMAIHPAKNLEILNDIASVNLVCTVRYSENKKENGIESLAFFPIYGSDKMIVIGIQNKVKYAESLSDGKVSSAEVAWTILNSSKTLKHWKDKGHEVHLWIACWKEFVDITIILDRICKTWNGLSQNSTKGDMMKMLGIKDKKFTQSGAEVSMEEAIFATSLVRHMSTTGKDEMRVIFGESVALFMDINRSWQDSFDVVKVEDDSNEKALI